MATEVGGTPTGGAGAGHHDSAEEAQAEESGIRIPFDRLPTHEEMNEWMKMHSHRVAPGVIGLEPRA